MKAISIFNSLIALVVIFLVWIPFTRIFMLDVRGGNISVLIISFILCLSSLVGYRKSKNKMNLVTFVIGLSPIIFMTIIAILAYLKLIPLAP